MRPASCYAGRDTLPRPRACSFASSPAASSAGTPPSHASSASSNGTGSPARDLLHRRSPVDLWAPPAGRSPALHDEGDLHTPAPLLPSGATALLTDCMAAIEAQRPLLVTGVGGTDAAVDAILRALRDTALALQHHIDAVTAVAPCLGCEAAWGIAEREAGLRAWEKERQQQGEVLEAERAAVQEQRLKLAAEAEQLAAQRMELASRAADLDQQWEELLQRQAQTASNASIVASEWKEMEVARAQLKLMINSTCQRDAAAKAGTGGTSPVPQYQVPSESWLRRPISAASDPFPLGSPGWRPAAPEAKEPFLHPAKPLLGPWGDSAIPASFPPTPTVLRPNRCSPLRARPRMGDPPPSDAHPAPSPGSGKSS